MGDNHNPAGQHAKGDKPFLPIIETVIHECDTRTGQDFLGVPKIQAMPDEVAAVLGLVPFEPIVALFVVTSNGARFPKFARAEYYRNGTLKSTNDQRCRVQKKYGATERS